MGKSTENLKIALVGAGNLATNLGLALSRAGHNIVCVYSRTEQSARSLAGKLSCPWTTNLSEVAAKTAECDIAILSVKDAVLSVLATQFPQDTPTLFLHTAGSMPLTSLPMKHRGVLYPMQTFSKERETDFSHIPTFLETECDEDKPLLLSLTDSITDNIYWLSSDRRKSLHLAAVFTCNFSNFCYDVASQILERDNIPFNVMLPLIEETTRKLQQLSPYEAQTGPAVRYDKNVIDRHLQMLDSMPDKQHLYEQITQMIHQRHNDQA